MSFRGWNTLPPSLLLSSKTPWRWSQNLETQQGSNKSLMLNTAWRFSLWFLLCYAFVSLQKRLSWCVHVHTRRCLQHLEETLVSVFSVVWAWMPMQNDDRGVPVLLRMTQYHSKSRNYSLIVPAATSYTTSVLIRQWTNPANLTEMNMFDRFRNLFIPLQTQPKS